LLLKLAISALCFFSLLVYCIIAKKSFQKTLLNKKRKGIFHPFLLKIFPTQKDAEAAFVASGVFASLTSVTP
jgi:hypothetical protein